MEDIVMGKEMLLTEPCRAPGMQDLMDELMETAQELLSSELEKSVYETFLRKAMYTIGEGLFRTILFDSMAAYEEELAQTDMDSAILKAFGIRHYEYTRYIHPHNGRWG